MNRSPKSVRFAKCPFHTADATSRNGGLTGLVLASRGVLIFRDHTKKVGRVTMPCPGSGKPAPEETQGDQS